MKNLTLKHAFLLIVALVLSLYTSSGVFATENDPPMSELETVEFYWAERSSPDTDPFLITHQQFEIYEEDGETPVLKVSIENLGRKGAHLTSNVYKATYSLAPGIYRWEGYKSNSGKTTTSMAGVGYFEVVKSSSEDALPQQFRIDYFIIDLPYMDSNIQHGSDFQIVDYLGNEIEPTLFTYANPAQPELGLVQCTYLVIMQTGGDSYDAVTNPYDVGNAYSYNVTPKDEQYSPMSGVVLWNRDTHFTGDFTVDLKKLSPAKSSMAKLSISLKVTPPTTVTISVTKGANLRLYHKDLHYTYFTEYSAVSKDSESNENYDIFTFKAPSIHYLHYEAGGNGFLNESQSFMMMPQFTSYSFTVDLQRLDNHVDKNGNNSWREDSILLNTKDSLSIDLSEGETFDLFPIRVWQAMLGDTMNYFTEPDMHIELIDGKTGESQILESVTGGKVETDSISLEATGGRGRQGYLLEGKSKGVSIIKITYDATVWRTFIGQHQDNVYSNTGSSDGKIVFERDYFNPMEPRKTAVAVVNVGETEVNSKISVLGIEDWHKEEYIGQDDTIYFSDEMQGVEFTLTPSSSYGDVHVRVHDPLHNTEWDDASAWTEYGAKASGEAFAIQLKDGRNIVEVRSGDAVKYHVISAQAIPVTITKKSNPNWRYGDPVAVGDEMTIHFKDLNTPVPKLSGIYNPHIVKLSYTHSSTLEEVGESTPAYQIANGADVNFSITEAGETTLSKGQIVQGSYGLRWGGHLGIDKNGMRPNFIAKLDLVSPRHSMLPDFTFYTEPEEEGDTASAVFTGKDPGATLLIKSKAGYVKAPEPRTDGTLAYTLPVGGPHKWYYAKGGYITKTGEFGVGADGAEISLPDFTDGEKTNQQEGSALVTAIGPDLLLRDRQEVSYDGANPPDLAKLGYAEYGYGGYTILHALVDAFKSGSVKVSFTAKLGLISPTVQVEGEARDGAGWVCEVNGAVIPPDKLWTTLVRDGDQILYYYNPANEGQQVVRFDQSASSVARGQDVALTLGGKPAGTSGVLTPVSGASIRIDGQAAGLTTGADGKAAIDTSKLCYGTHVVTAIKGEPNTLTYARALLTVTKPADAAGSGVSFRLIGAKKHEGQEGYGGKTAYQNWIRTVTYPLSSGQVTAYTIFEWALKNAGLSFTESTPGYIGSITAPQALGGYRLEEHDNGPNAGWMFTVNGIHSELGIRATKVGPGDEIVFHYVDDAPLEAGFGGPADVPFPGGWLTAPDGDPDGSQEGGVKTSAVRALIEDGGRLKQNDYTEASWAVFADALAKAKAAAEKTGATQAEIDTAYAGLRAAMDALVKTDSKQPDDKQPEDKKPEDKQPEVKPPPDKTPVDKADAKAKTVRIRFSANGGTIRTTKEGKKVSVKTLSKKMTTGKKFGKLPAVSRAGFYRLKGWYTAKSGGKKVTKNTKVFKKNGTLYARWLVKYGTLNRKDGIYSAVVRKNASSRSDIIGWVTDSSKFRITRKVDYAGTANDWVQVSYTNLLGRNITGYVYGPLIGSTRWADPS